MPNVYFLCLKGPPLFLNNVVIGVVCRHQHWQNFEVVKCISAVAQQIVFIIIHQFTNMGSKATKILCPIKPDVITLILKMFLFIQGVMGLATEVLELCVAFCRDFPDDDGMFDSSLSFAFSVYIICCIRLSVCCCFERWIGSHN